MHGPTGRQPAPLHLHLPHSLWPETGSPLHTTRLFAAVVSESHYVRIVDKGVGVMWAFCKHRVCSVLDEFLMAEGYVASSLSAPQALSYIRSEIEKRGWSADSSGQLPLLYVLGKYKSLRKGQRLWRGITSLPQPLLPKKTLHIAARSNGANLKLLCNKVPCCFLAQSISDVSAWFQWLDTINAQYVSEVDCKHQFNNICPTVVADHLQKASDWLAARKKWRMTEVEWFIRKDTKKLDRPGRAKAEKFWYLSHTAMRDTIGFEMRCNNFIRALGSLWSRHGCIPMGGSFSAQATDLHSLWGVYSKRDLFRQLGTLHISELGFPFWDTHRGIITLCQFRDNIPVASTYKDSPSTPII